MSQRDRLDRPTLGILTCMSIRLLTLIGVFTLCMLIPGCAKQAPKPPNHAPNIVLILADDLGIGDVGVYHEGAGTSRVGTPRMDGLAGEGMRFTDAHSPSAVCTPTRYGILTGEYAWRTRLKNWVLNGYGRALIEPGTETIASVLQGAGYRTAVVGKWHLGLGEFDAERPDLQASYDGVIAYGPREVGFDEVFIVPASLDMPPYVFVEGDRVASALTAETEGSKRRWDGGGGFWRSGAMGEEFGFYECLPRIAERASGFVRESAERDEPFFLYVPLTGPHTPWMPTDAFQGASGAGWYGDFVAQVDASIGQVLDAIDDAGVRENTIVIVTSDNGAHWRPKDVEEFGHRSHLGYRGMKADVYEAGHRVPLIVRWPGRVEEGARSEALVGLHDLFATLASASGVGIGEDAAPDSESFLLSLVGSGGGRESLVHHSGDGMFAIRLGRWKLIEGRGSGGFTAPAREKHEDGPAVQLFDLAADPGETRDLASERPEVVEELATRLERIRSGNHAKDQSGLSR